MKKEGNKFDKRCTRSAHVKLKTLLRDINKQRNTLCSWIRRHSVVKMSVLPKVIYKFNARVWGLFFFFFFLVELEKLILKFVWKHKESRTAKHLRKKSKLDNLYVLILRLIRGLASWYSG